MLFPEELSQQAESTAACRGPPTNDDSEASGRVEEASGRGRYELASGRGRQAYDLGGSGDEAAGTGGRDVDDDAGSVQSSARFGTRLSRLQGVPLSLENGTVKCRSCGGECSDELIWASYHAVYDGDAVKGKTPKGKLCHPCQKKRSFPWDGRAFTHRSATIAGLRASQRGVQSTKSF